MCGIAGIYHVPKDRHIDQAILQSMTDTLEHRGPDESKYFVAENVGLGFKRLSIVDIRLGSQPFTNEDKSIVLICNGEIFNYKELRTELVNKGYEFKTNSDIEVLIPLYIEYGFDFLKRLNGQFSIAIFDRRKDFIFLARDHFGICPLFYSEQDNTLLFGSEIKAILAYPAIERKIDLRGLDQVFTFPSSASPTTLFLNINSLPPGSFAIFQNGKLEINEYWDLEFPNADYGYDIKNEDYYIDGIEELLIKSIKYRLNADVPVGFYLSGGLDSSLIGGMMNRTSPNREFNSFSASFSGLQENKAINEKRFQDIMSLHLKTEHNNVEFSWNDVESILSRIVYHSETPLKETYNICSIALSKAASDKGIKVILSGEGADELFGGYAGFKFDANKSKVAGDIDLNDLLDEEIRNTLWGNKNFVYEKNEYEFIQTKLAIYSDNVKKSYKDFDCLNKTLIDKSKLRNRDAFHQRSYVDFRLRLSGHLIADHGDRMTSANSIEGRYPFLDVGLIEFIRTIPPRLMLNKYNEKDLLKKVASKYIPSEIIQREKFGFVAPGSPLLMRKNIEWVNDLLSYENIRKQGYFDPNTVERLKKAYSNENFILNAPYETDLLIIVITFTLLVDLFKMNYL